MAKSELGEAGAVGVDHADVETIVPQSVRQPYTIRVPSGDYAGLGRCEAVTRWRRRRRSRRRRREMSAAVFLFIGVPPVAAGLSHRLQRLR